MARMWGMHASGTSGQFLAQRRFAFVGVSRDPRDFSRALFRDLTARGYDVVPVNPSVGEVEGRRCYAAVSEVVPPVGAALLMTSPEATEGVVRDCVRAGVRLVWMHRGAGKGSVSETAVEFCRSHSVGVVPGACVYMFLPEAAFFHRAHGFFARLLGRRAS
jgi:uncharacterized protein